MDLLRYLVELATRAPAGAGALDSHRFANVSPPLREKHEGFAWPSLSRNSLQAETDRPGRKLLSVYVCVGLWLIFIIR